MAKQQRVNKTSKSIVGKKAPATRKATDAGSTSRKDTVQPLMNKFAYLNRLVSDYAVNQQPMIEAAMLALVAKENLLFYGPWGCNKTGTLNVISHLIGVPEQEFFSVTLDKYTTPDALLGPISMAALEQDRYERHLGGYMGTASIAYVGEVFRGNSATRVSLHTIMNEGYVDNGGKRVHTPLHCLFADSNNLPTSEADRPFYDRIMLRVHVGYLPNSEKDSFTSMLKSPAFDFDVQQPIMTFRDVQRATALAAKLPFRDKVFDELFDLRVKLAKEEIIFSDRRWKRALNVLQAHAWLRGAPVVGQRDLVALEHVLWDFAEHREKMLPLILPYATVSSAGDADPSEVLGAASKIYRDALKASDGQALSSAMMELSGLQMQAPTPEAKDQIHEWYVDLQKNITASMVSGN